jgi:hypothetical protein
LTTCTRTHGAPTLTAPGEARSRAGFVCRVRPGVPHLMLATSGGAFFMSAMTAAVSVMGSAVAVPNPLGSICASLSRIRGSISSRQQSRMRSLFLSRPLSWKDWPNTKIFERQAHFETPRHPSDS